MAKRKYRLKKKIKNFLIFYLFIAILFVASYTISRYVEVASGNGNIEIAKFNVTLNDIDVTEGETISLDYNNLMNTKEQKLAPNKTGYFQFVIDPSGTEVSLEYQFEFDFTEIPEKFKLTYFKVNDDETKYTIENNIIKNDLLLPNITHGFTEEDKTTIKVYWSWEQEDITNPDINDIDNKAISVKAIIKQKIN